MRNEPTRRRRAVAGLALAIAFLLTGCVADEYDVAYDTVFAARAQDAVERGWVPEWLPEESVDIRQRHRGRDADAILVATLGEPDLSAFCTPATGVVPAPVLDADWFDATVSVPLASPPTTIRVDGALVCDDRWYGVVTGGRVQLWRVQSL